MTTKDNCLSFKDKQNVFVDPTDNQYKNLNLNQNNHQRLMLSNNACSKGFKTDSRKKGQNNDFSHLNESKKVSNSWNKSNKHLSTTFLNLNRNFEEKNEFNGAAKSANNSTLSLHIAAYENAIEATNDSDAREKEVETLSLTKKWGISKHFVNGSTSIIPNPFEFPRQQEDRGNRPEVMRYSASQNLLNPNQMDEKNNQKKNEKKKAKSKKRGFSLFGKKSKDSKDDKRKKKIEAKKAVEKKKGEAQIFGEKKRSPDLKRSKTPPPMIFDKKRSKSTSHSSLHGKDRLKKKEESSKVGEKSSDQRKPKNPSKELDFGKDNLLKNKEEPLKVGEKSSDLKRTKTLSMKPEKKRSKSTSNSSMHHRKDKLKKKEESSKGIEKSSDQRKPNDIYLKKNKEESSKLGEKKKEQSSKVLEKRSTDYGKAKSPFKKSNRKPSKSNSNSSLHGKDRLKKKKKSSKNVENKKSPDRKRTKSPGKKSQSSAEFRVNKDKSKKKEESSKVMEKKKRSPEKRKQFLEAPLKRREKTFTVNVNEVLRIGSVLERYGLDEKRRKAFEWLAEHRSEALKDSPVVAYNLMAAIGDLNLSQYLVAKILQILRQDGSINQKEYFQHFAPLERSSLQITIAQFAHLLTVYGAQYQSDFKFLQNS